MRRFLTVILFVIFGLSLIGGNAQAQPNLNFKRITVNWPTIELYFSVGCDGNPAYGMAKQDFKIFENGVEVKDFTLWCPDPTARCAISVALVFDASGSMSGSGNAGAKQGGRAFVDLMDGVLDEATIIWFNTQVNIAQQMTTLKPLLYSAVDGLPAGGGTAVWDGCYAGLIELINNGVNTCRAVIVLTDGGDNASTRTPAEIISLANRNRIRVFTIGLGSSINATELEMIALLTGGRYYQTPNGGQLAAIYAEIMTIIMQGMQECVITYQQGCADGEMRTVELQLVNFCAGTDTKQKTYRAPLDSTTFSDLYMELGDGEGKGDSDIKIPLNLITPIDDEMFYPFTFTLLYDQQCVQFKSVATPPGALLEGVPITVTPVAGGVQIQTTDRKLLSGMGLLMEFTFHASDPEDTTCCEIEAIDPEFEQGCFLPNISPGEICVLPGHPVIACDLDAPQALTWNRNLDDYLPNPFSVTGRFFNTGDKEAENTRFKISYNSNDVQLVSPLSDEQTGTPSEIDPGNYSEVTWQIAAKRRSTGDSTTVCIMARFDNHEEVVCCTRIYIPPEENSFECSLDIPDIQVRTDRKGYTPMPFTVRAGVKNIGNSNTGMMHARIVVPPGFSLTGSAGERIERKAVTPSSLSSGQEGFVEWYLDHPVTATAKTAGIQVEFTEDDVSICNAHSDVAIPGLDIPFTFSLGANGPLSFCEGSSLSLQAPSGYDSYKWSTGNAGRSLVVRASGSYFCMVKTAEGQTGYSDTVQVVVHARPQPKLTLTGSVPLCEGDTLFLDAGAGYRSYLWSTGENTSQITVTHAGTYHVAVDNEHGCVGRSDTVVVTTQPSPPKPGIDRSGDLLTTAKAPAYQWLLDGQIISGATNQFHVATRTGSYQVRVSNEYGCTSISDELLVAILGIEQIQAPESPLIDVFPDPAHNNVTLIVDIQKQMQAHIWLADPLGRTERIQAVFDGNSPLETTLDLSGKSRGLYHVLLMTGTKMYVRKFMVY